MPNLTPPVTTVARALAYQKEISTRCDRGELRPLMTLYLTDTTSVEEIAAAGASSEIVACKLYPAGATTNSDAGVTDVSAPKFRSVLKAMETHGLVLCVHGEVTHGDVFDREAEFVGTTLTAMRKEFPNLKIVLEHATTAEAVSFVLANDNVGCTLTPQHLLFDRNDLLVGGLKPHLFCLPILKRKKHLDALRDAIRGGSPKFFLGTDSAPHDVGSKESACGCAGCYSAAHAMELYATAFERAGCLENLNDFACVNGARFYGLEIDPDPSEHMVLERTPTVVPDSIGKTVVPLCAGETLAWTATRVRRDE